MLNPLDGLFAKRVIAFTGVESSKFLEKTLAQLMASAREGHLCLPLAEIDEEQRNEIFLHQEALGAFVQIEEGRLYLQKLWVLEKMIMGELKRLLGKKNCDLNPSEKETSGHIISANTFSLNDAQKIAVQQCLRAKLTLLSGGPGTGKTYTAAAIVEAFDPKQEKKIVLAAPTGRAAEHLQASLFKLSKRTIASSTLHKLLKIGNVPSWTSPKERFVIDADLLIVDECSMIDAYIFARLLKSIPDHCMTVLMGDPYQLCPVGIGTVFRDLLENTKDNLSKAHLTKCMRTDNQEVLYFSKQVLAAEVPESFFLPSKEKLFENLPSSFANLSERPTPEIMLDEFAKCRFLNCLRVGPYGANAINEMVLKKIRAETKMGLWWCAPIMIGGNDAEMDLYNGELGVYIEQQGVAGSGFVFFIKGKRKIPLFALPKFEWAFCSSVHKSQGSEFDTVVVLVPPGSEIFGREMLYTAITRAKKSIKILAEKETLKAMVNRDSKKYSGL